MNATQTSAPTAHVHFFANMEQNPPLMIPLKEGEDVKKQAVSIHSHLKGQNARIGLDRVMALLSGQEEMFKGYEVVDLATHNTHAARKLAGTTNTTQAAPAPSANAQPPQPSVNVGARGKGRSYPPLSNEKKEVVPLKRGMLYTRLMEFMIRPEGATHKFMVEHSGNKTPGGVNDVLGWQIKQKGYGLRYDAAKGTYHLELPPGQKELIYAS